MTDTNTYIYVYINSYIHTFIRSFILTYLRTYIHTYLHTYVYIYIYIYTVAAYIDVPIHPSMLDPQPNSKRRQMQPTTTHKTMEVADLSPTPRTVSETLTA